MKQLVVVGTLISAGQPGCWSCTAWNRDKPSMVIGEWTTNNGWFYSVEAWGQRNIHGSSGSECGWSRGCIYGRRKAQGDVCEVEDKPTQDWLLFEFNIVGGEEQRQHPSFTRFLFGIHRHGVDLFEFISFIHASMCITKWRVGSFLLRSIFQNDWF